MIQLVKYEKEFVNIVYSWRQQKEAQKYNPFKVVDISELEKILEKEGSDLSLFSNFSEFRWYVKFEDQIVGNVSLKNINREMNFAEIGYAIDEKYQGRGIGQKSVKKVIEKIFKETSLRKIIAYVHHKNIPSCKILEKIGFEKEGLLREHFIINGEFVDEVFYGLLKKDFKY